MADSSNLSSLARSKLQQSLTKDSCSLHRWVLLKNSITRSHPLTAHASAVDKTDVNTLSPPGDDDFEEEYGDEETDSFLFPDAGKFIDNEDGEGPASEAQWLDALLETLADDRDDELSGDAQVSVLPVDDEEDLALSPLNSPMSSSDDLINQSVYFPPPVASPYPVPYPPLLHAYDGPETSLTPPYEPHAPPYYDMDESDTLSVPEAIEDTSDDESEAPFTPSLRSSESASLLDPASIPLPPERRRRSQPDVFVGSDSPYFYHFDVDPLPFAENTLRSYRTYADRCHEC
jgi:hypothetical protein